MATYDQPASDGEPNGQKVPEESTDLFAGAGHPGRRAAERVGNRRFGRHDVVVAFVACFVVGAYASREGEQS